MRQSEGFDTVLRALADPTRRALFERMASTQELTVGSLTEGSGVSQGAVSQHLKALKNAGLVRERPEGRNVYYRANPEGLQPILEWMTEHAVFWASRLDKLEALLRQKDTQQSDKGADG